MPIGLDRFFQNNPFLVAVICNFDVKSSNWYYHDTSSSEINVVDTITKTIWILPGYYRTITYIR